MVLHAPHPYPFFPQESVMRAAYCRHALVAMVLAVALSPALGRAAEADESWPQFRGPRGDGHASSSNLPLTWSETENVRWKTAIHGRGWSSPVVWKDQIWLTTATEDGKQMFAICVARSSGKIVHDLLLFENEKPAFCHEMNSYASPTPVVEEGRVYVHFGSYGTACLDTQTGQKIWERRDLPCDHFRGPGSSPIAFEDLLIVHYDGFDFQYVVAFDRATGDTVWKVDRDIDYGTDNGDIYKAYATPLVIDVNGQPQLISPASKATLSYDPRTGAEFWRVRYPGFSATARPLFGNGMLYLNTGFSKADLLAVRPDGRGDVTDSHVVWTVKKGVGSKPSQLLVDDLIFIVSDPGVASCVEVSTGEILWSERVDGQYSSSLLYAPGKQPGEGRVYLFNHEGKGLVLRAGRQFEVLAENLLDAGCLASPAVAGDALLVRTQSHLYRLETGR
jgi:outer membrane protein assembly factor BamB